MKKWQIVDLVRSFCIVAAMAVHNYSNIPFSHRWASWLWGRFCFNGIYGVFVFFIVSGFLITHVIDQAPGGLFEPKILRFYVNRAEEFGPFFSFAWASKRFYLYLGIRTRLFSPLVSRKKEIMERDFGFPSRHFFLIGSWY